MKKWTYRTNKQEKGGEQMDKKQRRTVDNKVASIIIVSLIVILTIIGAILIQTVNPVAILSQVESEEKQQLSVSGDTVYIKNVEDLKDFRNKVNAGETYSGKTIQLQADINLNSNETWTPIGDTYSNSFKGTFDGQNHVISGIKTDSSLDGQGLFGCLEGTVKNLGVINSSIYGKQNVGAIAGYMNERNNRKLL